LAYIFVADSMGLASFKFMQWAPKDAYFRQQSAFFFRGSFKVTQVFNSVQGHSRSSKVDDLGTNRKRMCNFLLVINSNYGPILHRFWDTATYWLKIAYFSYPSLIRCPRSLCSLLNFVLKLTAWWKLWGYPPVKTRRPHDRSLRRFGMIPACDTHVEPLAIAVSPYGWLMTHYGWLAG